MSIKKIDIAQSISSELTISDSLSLNFVNSFIDLIKLKTIEGEVKIANFGTFTNKITPQRIGRNPKTGKKHIITERVKLGLRVSSKIKSQLN